MNTRRAVKAKIEDRVDAERYRKLRAWFLSPHSDENFFENMPDGEEPATPKRFDVAVDSLPGSVEEHDA